MTNLPSNLPDVLRKHGLKVSEVDGWRTRMRPASTGGFAPGGVLCHHTATSKATSVDACLNLLVVGRSDLPGPLCQLSLGRDGTVYVVAAGRANHAGVAKPSGTMAGGDGNVLYIGIEAQNAGTGEPWPKAQYDAYVLLCAVLSVEITHNSAQTVRAHKETSVTGKIDPAGPTPYESTFDMDKFRARVAAKMKDLQAPSPTPGPVRAKRIKLGHPSKAKGQTEAFGDSDRGIAYFAKRGCAAVDGNALPSSSGDPANVHYHLFLRHGFERIDGKPESKSHGVDHFTLAQLHDDFWTAKGHYRIRPSIDRIRLAFSLGVDYEFEVKDTFTEAAARTLFEQVTKLQQQYPHRRVVVKALNGRPGSPVEDLRPFHKVGFPTLLTTHRPFVKTPAKAKTWIDEIRGFNPRWV